MAHAYGARIADVLGDAASLQDLGEEVAPGLYARELRYLQSEEWVVDADDALWRRSKLGLRYTPAERERVAKWLVGAPATLGVHEPLVAARALSGG